jgi:uncharacterized repeat protein (TIGR01451 family)
MFKSPRKSLRKITDSSAKSDRYIHYLARSVIWIGLLTVGSPLGLLPLLAAPLAPGTSIENQATGSFTDGEDPAALAEGIVSNIVKVTVAEVAGITITPGSTPAAMNGAVSTFEFTITNIGNDPTTFFLPQNATVLGGTQGTLQIVAYIDASGVKTTLATPIDLTTSTNTGALSDPTIGAKTSLGSIPVGAAIVVSVPVMVTATSGTVSVTLGNTTGQPADRNTPYLIGANGAGTGTNDNDVYTVDHSDPNTIAGEALGAPINGIREASGVLTSATVVTLVPLTCNNTFYQVRNGAGGSEVLTIDRNIPTAWALNTPIKTFPAPVHALGYNSVDKFLYAFDASVGGVPTTKSIKIDANGLTTEKPISGATPSLLANLSINAFTVGSNGTGYFWDAASHQFFTIDLSTGVIAVIVNSQDNTREIGDIAFNPIDGMIYGTDNTVKPTKLIKFNPAGGAGSITTIGSTGIAGSVFDSIYFDGNGSGYGYNNSGSFYQFNLNTGAASLTSNSSSVSGADGASCISFASPILNPNLLLVKRITAINGNTTNGNIYLNRYDPEDDINNSSYPYDKNVIQSGLTPPNSDKWPNTTGTPLDSTFLLGARNGGSTKPNGTIEYTIYFLSAGESEAKKVLFCDRVPSNVTFMPTAFNGITADANALSTADRGISIGIGSTVKSYSNVADGDIAQYFPPGADPTTTYPTVNCGGTNTNGAVVVNLGNIPNATGVGVPPESYGFVRFQGRVK